MFRPKVFSYKPSLDDVISLFHIVMSFSITKCYHFEILLSMKRQCWTCNFKCQSCDSSQDIQWNVARALRNPSGFAPKISLGLRLYFTIYPSSRHNTDTILVFTSHVWQPLFVLLQFWCSDDKWHPVETGPNGLMNNQKQKHQLLIALYQLDYCFFHFTALLANWVLNS